MKPLRKEILGKNYHKNILFFSCICNLFFVSLHHQIINNRDMAKYKKRYFIYGKENYKELLKVYSLPKESRIWHALNIQNVATKALSIVNDSEKQGYSIYSIYPKISNGTPYLEYKNLAYLYTYKDNNKTVSSNLGTFFIDENIQTLTKTEWLTGMYQTLGLSNNILKMILLGKITNPTMLLTKFVQSKKIKSKGFPIALLNKLVINHHQGYHHKKMDVHNFMRVLRHTTNHKLLFEKYFEYVDGGYKDEDSIFGNKGILMDYINDCELLKLKLNPKWKINRLKEEHLVASKIIERNKLEHLTHKKINYKKSFEDERLTILDNTASFYKEGLDMQHCVFSNDYFSKAQERRSFLFSYEDPINNERGTLEVGLSSKTVDGTQIKYPTILQFRSYRNNNMSHNAVEYVNEILQSKINNFVVGEVDNGKGNYIEEGVLF